VEEMMEANGELKVSYALPYDTQLTISYDDAPRIIDAKVI
jgi:hypothetical protein